MRLFLGTFLEKDLVEKIPLEEISKLFEGDLKTIRKENIHLTWIFIGDVETRHGVSLLQEIIENHINLFKGLIFQSHGLRFWPPKKAPRLIVTSGELNKEINLEKINSDLKKICNPDIKDSFLPHITIARFKKDKTVNKGFKLPQMENFIWEIKEVYLVNSTLTSEGPNYEKIKCYQIS